MESSNVHSVNHAKHTKNRLNSKTEIAQEEDFPTVITNTVYKHVRSR